MHFLCQSMATVSPGMHNMLCTNTLGIAILLRLDSALNGKCDFLSHIGLLAGSRGHYVTHNLFRRLGRRGSRRKILTKIAAVLFRGPSRVGSAYRGEGRWENGACSGVRRLRKQRADSGERTDNEGSQCKTRPGWQANVENREPQDHETHTGYTRNDLHLRGHPFLLR